METSPEWYMALGKAAKNVSFVDSHALLEKLMYIKTVQNKCKLRNYEYVFYLYHGQISSFFIKFSYITKATWNLSFLGQFSFCLTVLYIVWFFFLFFFLISSPHLLSGNSTQFPNMFSKCSLEGEPLMFKTLLYNKRSSLL